MVATDAALRHQLVVRAKLDDLTVLEHADAVGVAHRGKPMRDQDGRALATGSQDAIEDLRLAPNVELRRRFIQQHDAGALLYRAQGARQGDTLPLPARKVGAALVTACQHRVETGEVGRAGRLERRPHHGVRRARWGDVFAKGQLESDEILEHGGQARPP
jgi:hypothetical protein